MTVPPPNTPAANPDAAFAACRNCGAAASGAYCPACGQETKIALPTARQFLREAAGRYVALDGRLWRTLYALLFRPGFLTREYLDGRRRRYLRPARLFLVLSLALFALLRFVSDPPIFAASEEPGAKGVIYSDDKGFDITFDDKMNIRVKGIDGALSKRVQERIDHFNKLPRQDKGEQIFQGVTRYGPYALLGLLPAFAALLQIVYVGRRRRYPLRPRKYAEHLVFGAHNHSFLCLALMLAAIPLQPLRAALAVWIIAYFLRAMKSVYGGSWIGVLARAFVMVIAYAVLFAFVTAGLFLSAVLLR
jgi:hypothetical protein